MQGSLTYGDLQRIFQVRYSLVSAVLVDVHPLHMRDVWTVKVLHALQVTRCLGDQLPDSAPSLNATPSSRAMIDQQPVSLHQRTTSDLLGWADEVDVFEAPVTSKDAYMKIGSGTGNHQSSIALLDGLEHIAAKSLNSALTNEQAAAKALLNAARHNRKKVQQHAVSSKYMDGEQIPFQDEQIHFQVHDSCLKASSASFPCLRRL